MLFTLRIKAALLIIFCVLLSSCGSGSLSTDCLLAFDEAEDGDINLSVGASSSSDGDCTFGGSLAPESE